MPTSDPTVNYAWDLPLAGGDVGVWGTMLNTILGDTVTGIDPIVKGVSNVANAALPKAGGTMTGNLIATDNLYDIGASGATRFRDLFLSRNFVAGGTATITGAVATGALTVTGAATITGNVNVGNGSVIQIATVDTGRLIIRASGAGGGADGARFDLFGATHATNANQATLAATGGFSITGAVTLSSTLTFSAEGLIKLSTADGTDNQYMSLMASTARSATRGAYIDLYGNEHGGLGAIELTAGNVVGGQIDFSTGNELVRMTVAYGGQICFGTTVVTSAAASNIVMANGNQIRWVNAAATQTYSLLELSSGDKMNLGGGYSGSFAPAILGLAAASLPAAAAAANGLLILDTTNNAFIYYVGGARYRLTGTSF